MILFLPRNLLDAAIWHADDEAHQEAVGLFFEPAMAASPPQYLRLTNAHHDPTHNFWIDYLQVETTLFEAYGNFLPGRITLFHSHLVDREPSTADIAVAGVLAMGLATHPYWVAAQHHLVWNRVAQGWYGFDDQGWEHAL